MKITCFSQNILIRENNDTIILITPNQLKRTNLIFIEHQKLLNENDLLNKQLKNFTLDNRVLIHADSIRLMQIESYKRMNQAYSIQLDNINKELKKTNNNLMMWKIGGITISAGLLVWLLLK